LLLLLCRLSVLRQRSKHRRAVVEATQRLLRRALAAHGACAAREDCGGWRRAARPSALAHKGILRGAALLRPRGALRALIALVVADGPVCAGGALAVAVAPRR
jgi:hypothetical protein